MLLDSLLRDHALSHENIDQILQRFHIFLTDQVVVHGDRAEMNKAAVQVGMTTDVPERISEVVMVEMGVAAEHLLDDGFDIRMEMLGEARRFPNPFVLDPSKR